MKSYSSRKKTSFDDSQSPVDKKTLDDLCKTFQTIVQHIQSYDSDYVLDQQTDQIAIENFVKTMTELACATLFDSKGNLKKPSLADDEMLKMDHLAGSFISGVNQEIRNQLSHFSKENFGACQAFDNYLNKNRARWTNEVLRKHFPLKYPHTVSPLEIFTGVLTGVLAVGMFAIAATQGKSSSGQASDLAKNSGYKPF